MHRDAPRRMAKAARRAGTERFVLVSAMGAAPDAPSAADRSKAAGEQAVREELADAIIVRPALVYGPHDHFFARLAPMVQRTAAIPLIGGGRTRFQPIHVEDLADALTRALDDPQAPGRDYDLGAEEVFDLRGLIKRLCEALGRRPWLVPVPFALAELAARLPRAPLTLDQVRLLRTDKVARPDAARPAALCVAPRRLAPFLAGYHSRRE
jgi:NADH dehydrogenase